MAQPWESVYRLWNWLGIPVMMLALAAAVWLIGGLRSALRDAVVARCPLAERQQVVIRESGELALAMEAPRFSTRFGGLRFTLTSPDGTELKTTPVHGRRGSSGWSNVRVELSRYQIPHPGTYALRIEGLDGRKDGDENHAVVFSRPVMLRNLPLIVGLVAASGLFIGSLVLFILRLTVKR